jgi:hypothetical protein
MGNSTNLVRAVARATALSPETLTVSMRILRTAGLITVSGRGTSAARMTPQDAARLLIAAGGSHFIKESLGAAMSFGGLRAYRRELVSSHETTAPITMTPHWSDGPRHWSRTRALRTDLAGAAINKRFGLGWLETGTRFEDAMIGLIQRSLDGTLFPGLAPTDFVQVPSPFPKTYRTRLWVSLYRPQPYASVCYFAEGIIYEKVFFENRIHQGAQYHDPRQKDSAHLYRQTDFSDATLEIVCQALRQ